MRAELSFHAPCDNVGVVRSSRAITNTVGGRPSAPNRGEGLRPVQASNAPSSGRHSCRGFEAWELCCQRVSAAGMIRRTLSLWSFPRCREHQIHAGCSVLLQCLSLFLAVAIPSIGTTDRDGEASACQMRWVLAGMSVMREVAAAGRIQQATSDSMLRVRRRRGRASGLRKVVTKSGTGRRDRAGEVVQQGLNNLTIAIADDGLVQVQHSAIRGSHRIIGAGSRHPELFDLLVVCETERKFSVHHLPSRSFHIRHVEGPIVRVTLWQFHISVQEASRPGWRSDSAEIRGPDRPRSATL